MDKSTWARRCGHALALITLRQPAFWRRSWKHRLGRTIIYIDIIYISILLLLLSLEDVFLYGLHHAELVPPPKDVVVENVELASAHGERIHAWWSKPNDWRPEQGAVLFCHGNGGNLSYRGSVLKAWHQEMGVAVLLFDYPGYGLSSGEPSEAGCYAAGDAAYDWLVESRKVPPERILLYGGSLGGGIAVDLASRRPHRALVLVAAFTSFPDMAQKRFPWLPGRWLVRNRYDNLSKIAHCNTPVFIAHAPQDRLIPYLQAERLYAAAAEPKCLFAMPNYHHIDIPIPSFYPALRAFLQDSDGSAEIDALPRNLGKLQRWWGSVCRFFLSFGRFPPWPPHACGRKKVMRWTTLVNGADDRTNFRSHAGCRRWTPSSETPQIEPASPRAANGNDASWRWSFCS
jgi:fermentation-respiration switch protein FrsA (DUF1100 family)